MSLLGPNLWSLNKVLLFFENGKTTMLEIENFCKIVLFIMLVSGPILLPVVLHFILGLLKEVISIFCRRK
jgi:hypothetical protein